MRDAKRRAGFYGGRSAAALDKVAEQRTPHRMFKNLIF
jgi:hypothetical protein